MTLPTLATPPEMALSLAGRVRDLRLRNRWTRDTLAARAGITAASLKRFENSGKASLALLLKAAHALGRLEEFGPLLLPPPARSISELERRAGRPRKRGSL